MSVIDFVIIIVGFAAILGCIFQYRKAVFLGITDEEIEFTWKLNRISLDRESIDEIIISTIQGKFIAYYIITDRHKLKIEGDQISEEEIKSFSIKNDITLKQEEAWHGGGIRTIYESKEKK
ncbi:hypothetical protein [Marinifilum fragile]|uniref:hypothetical protein n=1 Tax=Marinifilum fragile TaxID=570161 RepID=UPI0006D0CA8E|nr:hypothetical protein [Marinifilum fragile]